MQTVPCPKCDGDRTEDCRDCHGHGCMDCHYDGWYECPECNGEGTVEVMTTREDVEQMGYPDGVTEAIWRDIDDSLDMIGGLNDD